MKKKILLIDPPFQKFMGFSKAGIPLGLLFLAGKLKKMGHEVEVLDSDYNPKGNPYPFMTKIGHYDEYLNSLNNGSHSIWESISSQIEESKPDVVGVSFISTKLRSGLRVAQIAKEMGVKRIVAGGPHVTIRPSDVIKEGSPVDYAIVGEAEEQMEVFDGTPKTRIIRANRIQNLDLLPWMARESLIGIENYKPSDLGFMMTSRGCPGSCNFCCSEKLWGKRVRFRNISDVIAEMDDTNRRYGTQKFYLTDDTFTLNKKRVLEFTKGIRDKGYEWGCLTRVDRLNEVILKQMVESGCCMIKLGIESGSQKVLDLMNKRTNLDQARNAAKLLNSFSVPWMAYVMVGVPGETSIDADATMRFIDEIKPTYVSAAIYTPYIGTGFYKNSIDFSRVSFLKDREGRDHAIEEANHHSLKVIAGDVSREKIIEFMEFADKYNLVSKKG
ncbi:MAG: B12-binding domain-containing radical SAM protein [Candidatus Pacebacteria bacterium]|nr:B12-binding domain-containing radical SAM protein [Candidatus Paceibacterota bacterium]